MVYSVDGEDIDPKEITEIAGWKISNPRPAKTKEWNKPSSSSAILASQPKKQATVLLRVLRVQLEVRQQNRDVLHELQQLRHEVRVVSERLDEIEPLDRTRAVSQPALSTVPPVLPRLPANNIEELEAAEAAVQDEAVAATLITHLAQEHECMSCCPNCNRDHPADDPDCKVRRTTDKAVWQAVYLKELQFGEEEERSAAQDKPKKVTIENPSTSQSRSKSRSKSQIEPRMKIQHVS
ncbi:hypothetical protein HPB49_009233 [Dermacentor silvarum]|uniref:Uncharacterized protein n=1 Tax=Dermacentor silvarum TaxID=543639 RepID=A0ACB8DYK6_DERSI|nr:hypothetical protein HPB49_009233 [Dermacentor silvarum]